MATREAQGEGGRDTIISVRLSPREEKEIKLAAAKCGEAVSSFVREAALKSARPARIIGPSWSSSPTTVAGGGTVLPRYYGTITTSQPASPTGTAATSAEPIRRSR